MPSAQPDDWRELNRLVIKCAVGVIAMLHTGVSASQGSNHGDGNSAVYDPSPYNQPEVITPVSGRQHNGTCIISAGTVIPCHLDVSIDLEHAVIGQEIRAFVTVPIGSGDGAITPRGSIVIGQIMEVSPPEHPDAPSNGKIALHFTAMQMPDGRRYPLSAVAVLESNAQAISARTGARSPEIRNSVVEKGTQILVTLNEDLQLTSITPLEVPSSNIAPSGAYPAP